MKRKLCINCEYSGGEIFVTQSGANCFIECLKFHDKVYSNCWFGCEYFILKEQYETQTGS